jgi:hypothetical protein
MALLDCACFALPAPGILTVLAGLVIQLSVVSLFDSSILFGA